MCLAWRKICLWIKGLIEDKNWKYLILQSSSKDLSWKANIWYRDLPGWRVNKGEPVSDTLHREIFEETGIANIFVWALLLTWLTPVKILCETGEYWLILSVYRCEIWTVESAVALSNEHISYEWVDKQILIERLSDRYPKHLLVTF